MKNKNTGFGQRIKLIRKSLKLLQDEFAEKLKISVTSLSEIENNKSRPGYHFFINIAVEYNVNLYYLLFGEGEMFYSKEKEETSAVETFINSIEIADARDFLRYFLGSKIVRFRMLSFFREFLLEKESAIKDDLEKTKDEK